MKKRKNDHSPAKVVGEVNGASQEAPRNVPGKNNSNAQNQTTMAKKHNTDNMSAARDAQEQGPVVAGTTNKSGNGIKMTAKDRRQHDRDNCNKKTQPLGVRKKNNKNKRQKRVDDAIHLIARVSDSINVDINATINERSRCRKTLKSVVQKPTILPTVQPETKEPVHMPTTRPTPVVPAPAPATTHSAPVTRKGKSWMVWGGIAALGAVGAGIWWLKKRS